MAPQRCWMAVVSLLLSMALVGCGGSSVEDELAESEEVLRESRAEVREARDAVREKQEALETAREEHDQARSALGEAEARLAQTESEVDLQATDALLFRGIQRKLLDAKRLSHVAIRVDVQKGMVTMYGTVPDAETRDAALEIARGFPGVVSVNDRIDVSGEGAGAT